MPSADPCPCSPVKPFAERLWDLWCIASVVGIWPRFIEPYSLAETYLELDIAQLPLELQGLKIVQFSDLHLNAQVSDAFLAKLVRRINRLKPDLLVFTGDFLCCSGSPDPRLKDFLCALSAPYGCYAIAGNHDYNHFVSINSAGDYDRVEPKGAPISRGFRRLFRPLITLTGRTTDRARQFEVHEGLRQLLRETPFQLLHNETVLVPVRGTYLNICGVGEHMMADCLPEKAFLGYDRGYPGLVLSHNPDTLPLLQGYPGDLILLGHTHGGQIRLPGIWRKFTQMENMEYTRGLFRLLDKYAYVNRGVGSVLKFRWFSCPELVVVRWKGIG